MRINKPFLRMLMSLCLALVMLAGAANADGLFPSFDSLSGAAVPEIGSTVTFGRYEQDNRTANGKEPIEWKVLDTDGDRVLVISVHALDAVSYGKAMDINEYTQSGLSWKTSFLREWLNGTFFSTAFSADEREKILPADLVTQDASGRVQTSDRVFVLSAAEADQYFRTSKDMACTVTAYGKAKLKTDQGAITGDGNCLWWLRDMTSVAKQADRYSFMDNTYNEAGFISSSEGTDGVKAGRGAPVFCDYLVSVRPAMWIAVEPDAQRSTQAPKPFSFAPAPAREPVSENSAAPAESAAPAPDPDAVRLELSPAEASVKKGASQKIEARLINLPKGIKAKKTVWSSSDESVAKVAASGAVKGVGAGEATVSCVMTLTDDTTVSAYGRIKVYIPVQSVKPADPKLTLQMGASRKLSFTFQPADATTKKLTFSSSDPSVVSVDQNGTVKPVRSGKATVTATTTDGTKKTSKVEIYVPSLAGSDSLRISNRDTNHYGIIKPVEYTFEYYGNGNLSVKSSDSKLFKCKLVHKSGNKECIEITPKRAGSGTITITDSGDKNSKLVVQVTVTNSAVYTEVKKGTAVYLSNGQTLRIKSINFTNKVTHKMYRLRKQFEWEASYGKTYMLIKADNGNQTGRSILGKNTLELWYVFDGSDTDPLVGFPTSYNGYTPMFYQTDNTDYIYNGSSVEMMYFADIAQSKKNSKDIWIYIKDSSHNTLGVCYYKESK